jgi:tetratricopeptide (TPR) repeat protein
MSSSASASATPEAGAAAEDKKGQGNAAFAAKDYPRAIKLYSEAIELNPATHVYFSNRSACYAAQGDHENAEKDAAKCVELDPTFIKGYYR